MLGCAFPEGEQGFNVARLVSFMAGLPKSLGAATVNRFCGSSMTAVHIAAGAISMDAGEVFIAAGVESMSRVPMMGFNPLPHPDFAANMPGAYMGMGDTAENVAAKWEISRARAGGIRASLATDAPPPRERPANSTTRSFRSRAGRARLRRTAASAPKPRSRRWPS